MTRQRRFLRSNNRGFNLIEGAIVLAIAGLVIAAVFLAWDAVSTQNKIKQAAESVTVVVSNIRTSYAAQTVISDNTGEGPFTTALVDAEIVPRAWVSNGASVGTISGNLIINPWNNFTTVNRSNVGGTAGDSFYVRVSGIPTRASCNQLLSRVFGAAQSNGLARIGGAATINITNATNVNDVTPACGTATNGARGLIFFFMLKTT